MRINVSQAGVHMARHETFSINDGLGYRIICDSGNIWITQDNDRRDIILQRGDSFTLDRAGQALIHAFEASAVAVKAKPCGTRPC